MKYAYKHSTTLFIVITMIVALGITTVGIQTARADDVRKAIESGNAKFMGEFNQGDSATVAALYTDDATVRREPCNTMETIQWLNLSKAHMKKASKWSKKIENN